MVWQGAHRRDDKPFRHPGTSSGFVLRVKTEKHPGSCGFAIGILRFWTVPPDVQRRPRGSMATAYW